MGDGKHSRPSLFASSDGIYWNFIHQKQFQCVDGCNVFFNPFRNVWSFSLQEQSAGFMRRARQYWESDSVMANLHNFSFAGTTSRLPCVVLWNGAAAR